VVLAVKAGAVAMPLALVVAVPALAKLPLAPLAGAVKVTVAPEMTLLKVSFTVACKAVVKAVLTVADCPLPAVAMMVEAGPASLVRAKLAGVTTPSTLAVIV
jgi:hypothetical protein